MKEKETERTFTFMATIEPPKEEYRAIVNVCLEKMKRVVQIIESEEL